MASNEKTLEKTLKVYDFIKEYSAQNGYAPSIREIAAAMNISSTATVSYYINKLEDLGYIKKLKNKNRAMGIMCETCSTNNVDITLINSSDNQSYLSSQNVKMSVPQDFFSGEVPTIAYALTVNDVFDSDFSVNDKLLIKQSSKYCVGDIILFEFQDKKYVARLQADKSNLFFVVKESNLKFDDCSVIGKVVSIIKKVI